VSPVGLVVLAELPLDDLTVDVRIGYLIAEASRVRGFATELLSGLVDWMRAAPLVHTLTGGLDLTNHASVACDGEQGLSPDQRQ
jgi:RimJ/RimL family protein N-acetyltransferase